MSDRCEYIFGVTYHPPIPVLRPGHAPLTRALLVLAALIFGPLVTVADDVSDDTDQIESLRVDQARMLAETFPGVNMKYEGPSGDLSLGLTTLAAETAKALAKYKGELMLPYDAIGGDEMPMTEDIARLMIATKSFQGSLPGVTAFETPDSVAVAKILATRKGRLALPNLEKISPKTLAALIEKEDVEIPLIETLELIPEPDGSFNDDFVIPERFEDRQQRQRAGE
jgi:hypothetical protein